MQGKIIKGIAGFYYVDVAESGIYECKAKGIFRKEKKKPLVGDNVEIEVLDEKEKTGNLIQILPRKNELIRPAAANVDQALVIFAVRQPDPNYQLLDRFLITMEQQEIPSIICFNKKAGGTGRTGTDVPDLQFLRVPGIAYQCRTGRGDQPDPPDPGGKNNSGCRTFRSGKIVADESFAGRSQHGDR